MIEPQDLTHDTVNGLLAALRKGRVQSDEVHHHVVAYEIGPAIEYALALALDPSNGTYDFRLVAGSTLRDFAYALESKRSSWTSESGHGLGFYRTIDTPEMRDERLHALFLFRAQRAAEASGFPISAARALVGSMAEIEGNIYEHSELHRTGLVAYQGGPGAFAFIIADAGIGVLASLQRSPVFQIIDDHGAALRLALKDGVSRLAHLDPLRGMGFHDLFIGLASLRGNLRFSTGDHALIIDGNEPSLAVHRLLQKEYSRGFMISVTCRVP